MAAAALGGGVLGAYVHAGGATPQPPAPTPIMHSPTATLPKETFAGLPTRLMIPAIQVDAAIEFVGLTPHGEVEAPAAALSAAWYKFGALPGDPGTAVIDGHVLGLKGEPGVFEHLDKVRQNDQLMVRDGHGQTATFTVREIRLYNANDQPAEIFNSTDGGAHLNLITCAGDWDPRAHKYLKRLVIFADKLVSH